MKYLSILLIAGCSQKSPSSPALGFEGLPSFFNMDYANKHQCITHTYTEKECVVTKVICLESEYAVGAQCKSTAPQSKIEKSLVTATEARKNEITYAPEGL